MSATLSVRDLRTHFFTKEGVAKAVDGVDFEVAPGEILGLVGESGAGKSMIGRVIAGNLPAGFRVTGGALRFGGQDLVGLGPEARRALLGGGADQIRTARTVQPVKYHFVSHASYMPFP